MNNTEAIQQLIEETKSTKLRILYNAVLLFSSKGYSSVGIREITRSVNIKESAFYNHFKSKESLLDEILAQFIKISSKQVFTEEELEEVIKQGKLDYFLKKSIQVYQSINNDPLYYTLLHIILMEGFTNAKARQLIRQMDYYDQLEKMLEQMRADGLIRCKDVKAITSSYYYGLKGIVQEFIYRKVWDENAEEMLQRMNEHVDLFIDLLCSER